MVDPVHRSAAGAEGIIQAAVEVFCHPFRLRVVGRGLVVLDVEQGAGGGPQGGGELGPAVCRLGRGGAGTQQRRKFIEQFCTWGGRAATAVSGLQG